jgi:hypothetical protein
MNDRSERRRSRRYTLCSLRMFSFDVTGATTNPETSFVNPSARRGARTLPVKFASAVNGLTIGDMPTRIFKLALLRHSASSPLLDRSITCAPQPDRPAELLWDRKESDADMRKASVPQPKCPAARLHEPSGARCPLFRAPATCAVFQLLQVTSHDAID